jgi:methylmalonyl-CoA/ethylmalonyl-CoA epimerase
MRFHHVGILVKNIKTYLESHNYPWFDSANLSELVCDPLQGANVLFVKCPESAIELIEPINDSSPFKKVLSESVALQHHICFEVDDLDSVLLTCVEKKMLVVSAAKPASAFAGRRIAFVMGRDKLLWELLEK